MAAPVITIMGPIGSGKTIQAHMLAQKLTWETFSTGQILRDAGNAASREAMKVGNLAATEYVQEVVLQHIRSYAPGKGIILDGSPRMLAEAKRLDDDLPEMGRKMDLVLFLQIEEPSVEVRLMARGRADDRPEVIKVRWQQYTDETMPVVDYYRARGMVRDIDAKGSPEEVAELILKAVTDAGLV